MYTDFLRVKCLKAFFNRMVKTPALLGRFKLVSLCLVVMVFMLLQQVAMAGQVTILAPREDTRVDFEKFGLRVSTYTQEQIENMQQQTAISLGQSIDASVLVLTGARISDKALASLFNTDEVRVALDDLFRRGGMLFIGQLSAGGMNAFSPQMREYFHAKGLYLPKGADRPTTQKTISHFKAYANSDLLDLPLLSKPNSLVKGKWTGVSNNIFYWSNFPDSVLPILTGPENKYPVMLLQKDILGKGTFIISQARDLTRMARSEFWENMMTSLMQPANDALVPTPKAKANPSLQSDAGSKLTADVEQAASAKPLFFLETFDGDDSKAIDSSNAFTDSRIWERFESVSLSIFNTAAKPQKATEAHMGIIGKHLVAAYVCQESDPKGIVAKVSSRDGDAWTDDCVELVLVPEKGGAVYHWIISASGAIYDAKDKIHKWHSNAMAYTRIEEHAWRAVVVIPLADVFEDGVVPNFFFANFAREEQGLREISSWVAPIHAIPTAQSTDYVSRLSARVLASRLLGREAEQTDKSTGKGLEIWQASAWENGLGLSSMPKDNLGVLKPALALHLPRGGTDATVLLVRNNDAHSQVFKINPPRELITGSGQSLPFADVLTLYRGVPRLSSYETLGFDPLEELGNSSLLTVGPGETAMLWIDASVKDGIAGVYKGQLSMLPMTMKDQQPIQFELEVKIYDVKIPDTLPLNVYTWGPYMGALTGYGDPQNYVKLAIESHINTFNLSYPFDTIKQGPVISEDTNDYLGNISNYLRHNRKVKFVYSYHLFAHFNRALQAAGFNGQIMDKQWQDYFLTWFGRWMNALQSKGITRDDFWVQIEDEPKSSTLLDLIAMTTLLRKHFPLVKIMLTIAPWSTTADIDLLKPYVDLWVPERRRLLMRETAASELAYYRKQVDFWPYRCSTQMDMQPLVAYYRYRGIQEYMLGANGIALWAFNSWGGDSWAQWDTIRADGRARFDEGLVYRGEFGPVPSMRLFAFRAGIEDYVLLHLLSQVVETASEKNKTYIAQLTEQARTILEHSDPKSIGQWRRKTLEFLDEIPRE